MSAIEPATYMAGSQYPALASITRPPITIALITSRVAETAQSGGADPSRSRTRSTSPTSHPRSRVAASPSAVGIVSRFVPRRTASCRRPAMPSSGRNGSTYDMFST